MKSKYLILTLALPLGACVATAPQPDRTSTPDSGNPDLACQIPSNCVSSRGNGGLEALPFAGTPTQAMRILQATLTTFPEATIVRSEALLIVVIFTTPAGFRDQVDFRIDPQAQRIDFRSRSLFGLFDWGKNRSRMQEFKRRFELKSRP